MSADLLQTFQIITKLGVNTVGENLGVFAIDDIALTIEEPGGDFVLSRVLDDGYDSLEFFGGELTGTVLNEFVSTLKRVKPFIPLVEIDIGFLANQVGVSASNTLDFGQGVHDLLFTYQSSQKGSKSFETGIYAFNIGIQEPENLDHVRTRSRQQGSQ
jgi:hypothetical protein